MNAENGRDATNTQTLSSSPVSRSSTRIVSPAQSTCVHSPGLHLMCIVASGEASAHLRWRWQNAEYM